MRVLSSRRFPGPAWEELDDVEIVEWPLRAPRPDAEVLAVVAATVDDPVLDLLPGLRLVANYGVGYDGVDVEACVRRGVAVTNTPGALGVATADLALALLLAVRRRIVVGDRLVRDGRWRADWDAGALMGDEIGGCQFVMRAATIEYHAPARFDDLLEIFVRVERIGRTSLTYDHAAYRLDDDALMVTAKQTLVLVDFEERRPAPVPDAFRDLVSSFEGVPA